MLLMFPRLYLHVDSINSQLSAEITLPKNGSTFKKNVSANMETGILSAMFVPI